MYHQTSTPLPPPPQSEKKTSEAIIGIGALIVIGALILWGVTAFRPMINPPNPDITFLDGNDVFRGSTMLCMWV